MIIRGIVKFFRGGVNTVASKTEKNKKYSIKIGKFCKKHGKFRKKSENFGKIQKKSEKIGKIQKKSEKIGKKLENFGKKW